MLDVLLRFSSSCLNSKSSFALRVGVLLGGLLLPFGNTIQAQEEVLTLQECHRLLRRNGPLAWQDSLVLALGRDQREEVTLSYLPRLALIGQVSYQSDVPQLDLPSLPFEITMPDKDGQAFYLQMQQPIWDGGMTYSQNRMAKAETDKRLWESRLAIEKLHRQLEHAYYSILLIDGQLAVQRLALASVERNAGRVDTLKAYGMASALDSRYLEMERLRLHQEIEQLQHARQGAIASLGLLMGRTLHPDTQLEMPPMRDVSPGDSIERIELKVQQAELRKVDASRSALSMTLTPKLFFHGQAGYAKPGPNIFNHELAPFYNVGLQVRWDLDALYGYLPHRRALRMQRTLTQQAENAFRQSISLEIQQLWHTYQGLEATLRIDSAMVSQCQAIQQALELRLGQGDATTHDLLASLTQWQAALLRQALHQVQRAQVLAQMRGIIKGWWYE